MNSQCVKVIAKSAWKEAEAGLVKRRIVVWQAESNEYDQGRARYTTHIECDLESGSALYFHRGHYDLSMGEAVLDFEERCNAEGIPPFPVTDDPVPEKIVKLEVHEQNDAQNVSQFAGLRSDWCQCKKGTFLCYPEDGACTCGIHKHHVHCICGGLLQTG